MRHWQSYTTKAAITTEHSNKKKTAGTHSANVKLHIVKYFSPSQNEVIFIQMGDVFALLEQLQQHLKNIFSISFSGLFDYSSFKYFHLRGF